MPPLPLADRLRLGEYRYNPVHLPKSGKFGSGSGGGSGGGGGADGGKTGGGGGGGSSEGVTAKKGDRLEFSRGKEHATGKDIKNFRGEVVQKTPDGRVMVNAGTKKNPKWVASHESNARPIQKKAPIRNESRQKYKESLAPHELKAIDAYQTTSYQSINGALRKGQVPSGVTGARIKALDSATSKGQLAKDTTLYRSAGGLGKDPSKLVGKSFIDRGFVSTSEKTDLPLKMAASQKNGVYARIKAPKGAKVGYLSKVRNQQAVSKYGGVDEAEALLPRDSAFKVLAAKQGSDGMWTVDMELVA
jgi:hypothetical protein